MMIHLDYKFSYTLYLGQRTITIGIVFIWVFNICFDHQWHNLLSFIRRTRVQNPSPIVVIKIFKIQKKKKFASIHSSSYHSSVRNRKL